MQLEDLKVLVVEDDEPTAKLLESILRHVGCSSVTRLADWVDVDAAALDPDLAIVDIHLPSTDGFRVLSALRRGGSPDNFLPVLVVTSDNRLGSRMRALASGASDLLHKPIEPWEVELRVRHLLEARRMHLRLREQSRRLEALLGLQRDAVSLPLDQVYDRMLQTAVDIVPGAEAGTVMVRSGEVFRFQSAEGYDLEALREVEFGVADMAEWHGGDSEGWRRAEPRVISTRSVEMERVGYASEPPEALKRAGRLDEIQANLYLPVIYQGEILAVLNLDNLHDSQAFSEDSLEAARMFGPLVASLLHEARYRRLLEEAALTDPLTGLDNRRSFDALLNRELSRSERSGGAFSLLLMDLVGFKRINDEFGHSAGDAVLVELTEKLQARRRAQDVVARWGGDEFTVLLPETPAMAALEVAQRFKSVTTNVCREAQCLAVSIGVASYPDDGDTAEALVQAADRRMYAAKSAGVSIVGPGPRE